MLPEPKLPSHTKEVLPNPVGASPPQARRSSVGRFLVVSGNAGAFVRVGLPMGLLVLLGVSYSLVQSQNGPSIFPWLAGTTLPSKCSDECFEHGTCNEERGECFCLPPWTGKDCNELAMPACQLSENVWTPCKDITTCECMQECQKYALPVGPTCLRGTEDDGSKITDLNALFAGPRYPVRFNADFTEMLPPDYRFPVDQSTSPQMNPEECPGMCGGHSNCGREHHNCYCSWATQGQQCEDTPSGLRVPCFNGCSGKGDCVFGTCKCDRGFFGLDCSLHLDRWGNIRILERPPYNWTDAAHWPQDTSTMRPKIFVYDLPTYFNTWQGLYSNFLDWAEPIWFVERMHNTPYRTAIAEEADFFFIPLFIRNRDSNRAGVVRLALEYIKENYPSNWARTNGSDHFVLTNSDWGNCELGGPGGYMYGHMQPVLDDIFTLTLWGCTKSMDLDDDRPCFRPGRDLVIPPDQDITVYKFAEGIAPEPPQPPFDKRTILLYFRGYPALDKQPWGKGNYTWDFNVRQEMFNLYYNPKRDKALALAQAGAEMTASPNEPPPTGIVLETMDNGPWDYWHLRQMQRSIFCLGPAGWGWGARAPQAVIMGCIPVVIQPYTKQAFEDEGLDWTEIGLVLTKEEIPNIEKILSDIPPEVIQQKRKAMERIKNRLIWSSTNYNPLTFLPEMEQDKRAQQLLESDAFEGIMEALRGRLRKAGKL